MPELIRRGAVEADAWSFVGLDAEPGDAPLPVGPVAVPLAVWKARRAELLRRGDPAGVWLAPADAPEELQDDLAQLSLVAVRFPKFTDGRGYSTAKLLRRSGYRGELRAFGDLGRDQLFYLSRCGFDAFALRPGADLREALASLRDFTEPYQGSFADPRPLFRRRAAAAGGAPQ
jgi:uncharacterized protein (DUF934 family)